MIVTGAAGMLGSQVLVDAPPGVEVLATVLGGTLPEIAGLDAPALLGGVDLAQPEDVDALVRWAGDVDAVIHCAAYTDVDGAESDAAAAERANAQAPAVLAAACQRADARLVVVSTDFVFDGTETEPYDEDAPTAPLGVYGRTKLAGERAALAAHPGGTAIARTQWLYGPRGKHFPGTMLALAAQGRALRVVDDQIGAPTSTAALSPALWDLALADVALADVAAGERTGVFHAACEGRASWYELARRTFELAGVAADLTPCSSAEFPTPAPRPAFSVLNCRRLADLRGRPLPSWQDALSRFITSSVASGH